MQLQMIIHFHYRWLSKNHHSAPYNSSSNRQWTANGICEVHKLSIIFFPLIRLLITIYMQLNLYFCFINARCRIRCASAKSKTISNVNSFCDRMANDCPLKNPNRWISEISCACTATSFPSAITKCLSSKTILHWIGLKRNTIGHGNTSRPTTSHMPST